MKPIDRGGENLANALAGVFSRQTARAESEKASTAAIQMEMMKQMFKGQLESLKLQQADKHHRDDIRVKETEIQSREDIAGANNRAAGNRLVAKAKYDLLNTFIGRTDVAGQSMMEMLKGINTNGAVNVPTDLQFKPYRLTKEGTDLGLKFMDRATKFSGDYEIVRNNMMNIEAAYNRIKANPDLGSRVATDQAAIISFNKILDPTSVVRESEYERTPANISLINRAKAFKQRIEKGGVIPLEDIEEIRNTAQDMAELRRNIINKKLETQIRKPASLRGLDPNEIAPLYDAIIMQPKQQSKQDTSVIPTNKANPKINKWLEENGL